MNIYKSDFKYEMKNDRSPLTKADKRSNDIICKSLQSLTPKIPVLSEESSDFSLKEREQYRLYTLLDSHFKLRSREGMKFWFSKRFYFLQIILLLIDLS